MALGTRLHLDVSNGVTASALVAALAATFPEVRRQIEGAVAGCLTDGAAVFAPVGEGKSQALQINRDMRFSFETGRQSIDALAADLERLALGKDVRAAAKRLLHRLSAATAHFDQGAVSNALSDGAGVGISLLDIVVGAALLASLDQITITASALPLDGSLSIATLEIGRGLCFVAGKKGVVSPIGLALLSELKVNNTDRICDGALAAAGIGFDRQGGNDISLRAFLLAPLDEDADVVILTFDVDDMTGEEIGIASERLRAIPGVLDLSLGSRLGKKQRPMTEFQLLIRPDALNPVRTQCFLQTSTIGLRWRHERRTRLVREMNVSTGATSSLQMKTVRRPDGTTTTKVESDSLEEFENLADRRAAQRQAESSLQPPAKDPAHE